MIPGVDPVEANTVGFLELDGGIYGYSPLARFILIVAILAQTCAFSVFGLVVITKRDADCE